MVINYADDLDKYIDNLI